MHSLERELMTSFAGGQIRITGLESMYHGQTSALQMDKRELTILFRWLAKRGADNVWRHCQRDQLHVKLEDCQIHTPRPGVIYLIKMQSDKVAMTCVFYDSKQNTVLGVNEVVNPEGELEKPYWSL
ncbi:MAG: hypothetical protein WCL61_00380 [bacterium]